MANPHKRVRRASLLCSTRPLTLTRRNGEEVRSCLREFALSWLCICWSTWRCLHTSYGFWCQKHQVLLATANKHLKSNYYHGQRLLLNGRSSVHTAVLWGKQVLWHLTSVACGRTLLKWRLGLYLLSFIFFFPKRCERSEDSYRTVFHEVNYSRRVKFPQHLKRFEVTVFTFVQGTALLQMQVRNVLLLMHCW